MLDIKLPLKATALILKKKKKTPVTIFEFERNFFPAVS